MPAQDTSKIKDKIISVLKLKGPSLPVHISREIDSSILFTSAFLSELISEKRVKTSNTRVGSSPLYLIQGQEPMLERFSHHLKSKEKEAFILLKEKKFLEDSKQHPAIRVALREIKDFAIPFQINNEIFWRFFTVPESEFTIKEQPKEEKPKAKEEHTKEQYIEKEIIEKTEESKKDSLDIFDNQKEKSKKQKRAKRKNDSKKENLFFSKLKASLSEKGIEIIGIENFSKNEIILRVRENLEEKIIFSFNKKRVTEKDIIKASKKATEYNMPYKIISLGEPLKKIQELIEAVKSLSGIEKI